MSNGWKPVMHVLKVESKDIISHICGVDRSKIERLKQKYATDLVIMVPHKHCAWDLAFHYQANSPEVEAEIRDFFAQEIEDYKRILQYKREFDPDEYLYTLELTQAGACKAIGKKGADIQRVEEEFEVKIISPNRNHRRKIFIISGHIKNVQESVSAIICRVGLHQCILKRCDKMIINQYQNKQLPFNERDQLASHLKCKRCGFNKFLGLILPCMDCECEGCIRTAYGTENSKCASCGETISQFLLYK